MFGAVSPIKQLAVDRGLIVKSGNTTTPVTHLTYGGLDGMGKLSISPGDSLNAFAQAYCRGFAAGWVSAITENKPAGAPMRFYLDYDFEEETYPCEEAWRQLEEMEKQELGRFFPDRLSTDPIFQSVVATSGVLDSTAPDGSRRFKSGIHVYYPNLFVTVEMALYISTAILSAAKKRWPKQEGVWEKQIDQKVYAEKRGLRWVWQAKSKDCERCKDGGVAAKRPTGGVRKPWCEECSSSGQVVDLNASMYAPLYRVDGTYRRTLIVPACRVAPTPALMLECSIMAVFSPEPTPGFMLYPGAEPKPYLKHTARAVTLCTSGDTQIKSAMKSSVSTVVPRDSPVFRTIENAVRQVHPMYKFIDARQVLRFNSASSSVFYRVYITGKGSGFCQNINRDHKGARVYFLFLKSGVRQKCCCECETDVGRVSGHWCSKYESEAYPISAEDDRVLFNAPDASRMMTASSSSTAAKRKDVSGSAATDESAFSKTVLATEFLKSFRGRWPAYDSRSKPTGPEFSLY